MALYGIMVLAPQTFIDKLSLSLILRPSKRFRDVTMLGHEKSSPRALYELSGLFVNPCYYFNCGSAFVVYCLCCFAINAVHYYIS